MKRLDVALTERGLARSRSQAGQLIAQGKVLINGAQAAKNSVKVSDEDVLELEGPEPYASRGAGKLEPVLRAFGVRAEGLTCLDAGASTGGFTDVLLREGAKRVFAVDIGEGQLVPDLAADERVTVRDHCNVRFLSEEDIGGRADLTVADLSFISLPKVLPALAACTSEDGILLPMVKPQFEVGKAKIGNRGVVTDPALRREAVQSVIEAGAALGWNTTAVTPSPLPGPSGNVEFFAHMKHGRPAMSAEEIRAVVESV
ncbi:TlyA family RNA methyltransferase [Salininema proteolyticum]|uniref:TlyA family RNA methyltransferase n=1 Tax=Salininema proteolyticum TaxID=1607685 RepID=A0ABV8U2Q7_9ACTN